MATDDMERIDPALRDGSEKEREATEDTGRHTKHDGVFWFTEFLYTQHRLKYFGCWPSRSTHPEVIRSDDSMHELRQR